MTSHCLHAVDVQAGTRHVRRLCTKDGAVIEVSQVACLVCKGIPIPVEPPVEPPAEPPLVEQPSRPDLQFEIPDDGKPYEFARPVILPDGSISYKKTGWEPPPTINGYVRDLTNKWLFHPLWPFCAKRIGRAFIRGECGCVQVEMRCDGKIVYDSDCRRCKNGVRL